MAYLCRIGPPSAWASLAEGGPPLLRHTSQTPPLHKGGRDHLSRQSAHQLQSDTRASFPTTFANVHVLSGYITSLSLSVDGCLECSGWGGMPSCARWVKSFLKNAIVCQDPQPKIKALLGVSTYINVAPNYLGLISRGGAPSTETHFPDPPPPSHKGRGGQNKMLDTLMLDTLMQHAGSKYASIQNASIEFLKRAFRNN